MFSTDGPELSNRMPKKKNLTLLDRIGGGSPCKILGFFPNTDFVILLFVLRPCN